jgi:hypothetical protein
MVANDNSKYSTNFSPLLSQFSFYLFFIFLFQQWILTFAFKKEFVKVTNNYNSVNSLSFDHQKQTIIERSKIIFQKVDLYELKPNCVIGFKPKLVIMIDIHWWSS